MTREGQVSCYKKYTVHQYSSNIGITTCTRVAGQKIHQTFLRLSKQYNWNGTRLVSYRLFQIIIYEKTLHLKNNDVCN